MCLAYRYFSTELATFVTYADACSWIFKRSHIIRTFSRFCLLEPNPLSLSYYPLRLSRRRSRHPQSFICGSSAACAGELHFLCTVILFASGLSGGPYHKTNCSLLWLPSKMSLRVIARDWGNLETLGPDIHIITYISMHYSHRPEERKHTNVSLRINALNSLLDRKRGCKKCNGTDVHRRNNDTSCRKSLIRNE